MLLILLLVVTAVAAVVVVVVVVVMGEVKGDEKEELAQFLRESELIPSAVHVSLYHWYLSSKSGTFSTGKLKKVKEVTYGKCVYHETEKEWRGERERERKREREREWGGERESGVKEACEMSKKELMGSRVRGTWCVVAED